MAKSKQSEWFLVDNHGMSRMYGLYNKSFIVRELLQNAFDENITKCSIGLEWNSGIATIVVEDNSPEGFKDLKDAYTLYKHTDKRGDASKRGRFNLGEKQAISQAEHAIIKTTKGSVTFDKINGRTISGRSKTAAGSVIQLVVKMKKDEFNECVDFCKKVYIPDNVDFFLQVNSEDINKISYKPPFRNFTATLPTVLDDGISFRPTARKTVVNVYKGDSVEKFLFELGLPVCSIDCDFDIDVQQKVPLSEDRNSVSPAFLKRLYAEVLNNVHDVITEEDSSRVWVRTATTSDAIQNEVAVDIFTKRFGDKALVANPNDPRSIDKAVSGGYNVIYGAEMDKEEWNRFKSVGLGASTSAVFGSTYAESEPLNESEITANMKKIANFAKKIALHFFNINIKNEFIKSPKATVVADYGHKTIRWNVSNIPNNYWNIKDDMITEPMLKLMIHEIAHEKGTHYETAYHEAISTISCGLVFIMKNNPKWFLLWD